MAGVHDTVGIQTVEGTLQQRANDLDDMVATTGAAFLGLTVDCARCHDHKFDPIPQKDYYRLTAVLAGVRHGERPLSSGLPTGKEEQEAAQRGVLPSSPPASATWTPRRAGPCRQPTSGQFTAPDPIFVLKRGDVTRRGAAVTPGGLSTSPACPRSWTSTPAWAKPAGGWRLARWVTDPRNPLTARVMVNRVWQYHFGRASWPRRATSAATASRPPTRSCWTGWPTNSCSTAGGSSGCTD